MVGVVLAVKIIIVISQTSNKNHYFAVCVTQPSLHYNLNQALFICLKYKLSVFVKLAFCSLAPVVNAVCSNGKTRSQLSLLVKCLFGALRRMPAV